MAREQVRGAREVLPRQGEPGLRQLDVRLGMAQRGLVGARIDQEEEIALVDDRAVLKVDRLQVAAHPRADLDRIDGVEARRELVPLGDLARDGLDDLHLRRWWRRRRPCAARREDEHGGQECPPRHGQITLRVAGAIAFGGGPSSRPGRGATWRPSLTIPLPSIAT